MTTVVENLRRARVLALCQPLHQYLYFCKLLYSKASNASTSKTLRRSDHFFLSMSIVLFTAKFFTGNVPWEPGGTSGSDTTRSENPHYHLEEASLPSWTTQLTRPCHRLHFEVYTDYQTPCLLGLYDLLQSWHEKSGEMKRNEALTACWRERLAEWLSHAPLQVTCALCVYMCVREWVWVTERPWKYTDLGELLGVWTPLTPVLPRTTGTRRSPDYNELNLSTTRSWIWGQRLVWEKCDTVIHSGWILFYNSKENCCDVVSSSCKISTCLTHVYDHIVAYIYKYTLIGLNEWFEDVHTVSNMEYATQYVCRICTLISMLNYSILKTHKHIRTHGR